MTFSMEDYWPSYAKENVRFITSKNAEIVYEVFIKHALREQFILHESNIKSEALLLDTETNKSHKLHPQTLHNALDYLIRDNLIKRIKKGQYEIIKDTPKYYKWIVTSDLEEYSDQVFSDEGGLSKLNLGRILLFGAKKEEVNDKIISELSKIEKSLINIYYELIVIKMKEDYDKKFNDKIKNVYYEKSSKILALLKYRIFNLVVGLWTKDREKIPSKELHFSNLICHLFNNESELDELIELDDDTKIFILNLIWKIYNEFNPKNLSVYLKLENLSLYVKLYGFEIKDSIEREINEDYKKKLNNIYNFINKYKSQIFEL